jgi:hypothetical protein
MEAREKTTVVLVTHNSIFARYLARALFDAGAIDRVIVESGKPSWKFYWRKFRRVGPFNAVFQTLLNRWFRTEGARWLPDVEFPPHDTIANINGYSFLPNSLIIGFGTSIISAKTLENLPQGFLNLHTGWLPDYRGVKSEFWTIARGDVAKAGWTLHYMTARLDDGDIVLRRGVSITSESAPQLRARLLNDVVPALIAFVMRVREVGFESIPRQKQEGGVYFTTPTWRDWLAYRKGGH